MNAHEALIVNIDDCIKAAKAKLEEIEHFEIEPDDWEDQYREMLNENGEVNICGFMYDSADALERLDPTAFRCGLIDFVDGIDRSEDPNFKELLEELDDIRDELDSYIDDVSDLRTDEEEACADRVLEGVDEDPEVRERISKLKAAEERGTEVLQEIDSL